MVPETGHRISMAYSKLFRLPSQLIRGWNNKRGVGGNRPRHMRTSGSSGLSDSGSKKSVPNYKRYFSLTHTHAHARTRAHARIHTRAHARTIAHTQEERETLLTF